MFPKKIQHFITFPCPVLTLSLCDQDTLVSSLLIATVTNQNSPKLDYCKKYMETSEEILGFKDSLAKL